jgi:hypothetical protein
MMQCYESMMWVIHTQYPWHSGTMPERKYSKSMVSNSIVVCVTIQLLRSGTALIVHNFSNDFHQYSAFIDNQILTVTCQSVNQYS